MNNQKKTFTTHLKEALFLLGVLLFLCSSFYLFMFIAFILSDGIEGFMNDDTPDSLVQIAILRRGFYTLISIGLVIISLLLIKIFKD